MVDTVILNGGGGSVNTTHSLVQEWQISTKEDEKKERDRRDGV